MIKAALVTFALLISNPALSLDPYARNDAPNTNIRERGLETYNRELDANERIGVTCSLYLDGTLDHKGYCRVGRRDSVSLINTGTTTYKIVRDSRTTARFLEGVAGRVSYGVIYAEGNCWVGPRVRYCAD